MEICSCSRAANQVHLSSFSVHRDSYYLKLYTYIVAEAKSIFFYVNVHYHSKSLNYLRCNAGSVKPFSEGEMLFFPLENSCIHTDTRRYKYIPI